MNNAKMPLTLVDFRVWSEGESAHEIGHADVSLPELAAITETIKGAGIAGEVDVPVTGQFSAMSCTINWRVILDRNIELGAPNAQLITLYGSEQVYSRDTGRMEHRQLAITMRIMSKTLSLGKLEAAAATDTSNEFEVTMIKILVDGIEKLCLDKINYIYRVGGVDYLAAVRANLGMA